MTQIFRAGRLGDVNFIRGSNPFLTHSKLATLQLLSMTIDASLVSSASDFTRAVREWISSGGDPNVEHPVSKATLLHTAAELQDVEAAERLIEAGADLAAQDQYGQTPLHIAVDSELDVQGDSDPLSSLQVTKLLLARERIRPFAIAVVLLRGIGRKNMVLWRDDMPACIHSARMVILYSPTNKSVENKIRSR